MSDRTAIHAEIDRERDRQDTKWQDQGKRCDVFRMLSALGEELGEAHTAANDAFAQRNLAGRNLREELIQIAATAVKAIERYDARLLTFDFSDDASDPADDEPEALPS